MPELYQSTVEIFSEEELNKIISKPYDYIDSLPGKNIRDKIAVCFNHWFKVTPEKFKSVCKIIRMLHNASLIIDDIEDGSDLRRGSPSTHKVYGVPFAINAANYIFVKSLQELRKLDNKKSVEIYVEQMISLHQGQGMEIYWRDCNSQNNIPTEAQYESVVVKKASGLFLMLVQLLQNEALDEKRDFKRLVTLLGFYFQIRDDLSNLCSKEYEDTKGFCEDITEGKFSFPVIHAMNSGDSIAADRIMKILKMRTLDIILKKEFVEILKDCGSFEYTRGKLKSLKCLIFQEIDELGGNPLLENLFNTVLSC